MFEVSSLVIQAYFNLKISLLLFILHLIKQEYFFWVEIRQQYFVVVKSQEDEKHALLSQGTGYLQNFTSNIIEVEKLRTGEILRLSDF